jgi:hypothetical protein
MTQQVYVVAFTNGSCGSFILALIERLTNLKTKIPFLIGQWASAHKLVTNRGFDDTLSNKIANYPGDSVLWWDLLKITAAPNQNIYITSHIYDPASILRNFPSSKVFVITHTAEDAGEIAINNFFKSIVAEWNTSRARAVQQNYKWVRAIAPHLFTSKYGTPPSQLNKKEMNAVIEILRGETIRHGMHMVTIPEQYRDSIIEIKYRDIFDEPEKVLEIISQHTGHSITDFMREQYATYLNKQVEFKRKTREILT